SPTRSGVSSSTASLRNSWEEPCFKDFPLKKGISAKDRGENKSPHSEQHSALSSFWFRYITRMSVKQLGGLALRSLHTRASPSGERAASGLLAGHGRRNSCLQVPGSLSPQPTRDRR